MTGIKYLDKGSHPVSWIEWSPPPLDTAPRSGWKTQPRGMLETIAERERWRRARMEQRFWVKVDKTDGCWLWLAHTTRGGYGTFTVENYPFKSHRVAYELTYGPIPAGHVLDHLCKNPTCVRPDHLEAVTHRENTLRGDLETSRKAVIEYFRGRTHCKYGHEFNEENTYRPPGRPNSKTCRACRSQRTRESVERKRAAQ